MSRSKVKKDIIFLVGAVLSALTIWGICILFHQNDADIVLVIQDGSQIGAYPLEEDKIVIVTWGEDEYNLLMISDGTAFVSDADCPDKLCVHQKPVSKNHESIICLPNKVIVEVDSSANSEFDAVTN